jgi:hypothetical protein
LLHLIYQILGRLDFFLNSPKMSGVPSFQGEFSMELFFDQALNRGTLDWLVPSRLDDSFTGGSLAQKASNL